MDLSDIADGIVVTDEQDDRSVAVVDGTETALASRLEPHAEALPCTAAQAATVLETYRGGGSLAAAATAADLVPIEARAALYLLGVEGVVPDGALRAEVREWIDGEVGLAALERHTAADEATLALAAYVETHERRAGLGVAGDGWAGASETVARRQSEALADATAEPEDLR